MDSECCGQVAKTCDNFGARAQFAPLAMHPGIICSMNEMNGMINVSMTILCIRDAVTAVCLAPLSLLSCFIYLCKCKYQVIK